MDDACLWRLNFRRVNESGNFLKCECPHCGQSIEYPSEGTGRIVPCPACEKPVTLEQSQANSEAQRKREWDEWIALNERLNKRQIQSGTTSSEKITPTQTPADAETQRKKEQDEWIALHERLNERRIKSDIAPSEEFIIPQNTSLPENAPVSESQHYEMYCPLCGEFIKIPTVAVGQKIACSHCRSEIAPVFFTKNRPKKDRSRFPLLTEETIRKTNQKGETPLHRAAKLGKICEIPKHLLTIELFMTRNNSFGGATPIHLAAEHGHLDQVPKEFLTKETLTDSTEYQNKESKTGPTPPRTETPLHVAARCGHGDQIPKEFLTPVFLSIEASGYRLTVLHNLAYSKRLDLVPDIYANSGMWNLRNSQGQTPRDVFNQVIERERIQREREAWRPPHLTLPIQHEPSKLLPVFTDESLREIKIKATTSNETYTVNLLDYTCDNPLCLEIHSGVPSRDFGRLCKHIIMALRENNLVAQLPPIARGIVQNGSPFAAFGIYPGRFAKDIDGNPIYITGRNYDGWINIFALWRQDGVNYCRFGYNVDSRRWYYRNFSYLHQPRIDESILHSLKMKKTHAPDARLKINSVRESKTATTYLLP